MNGGQVNAPCRVTAKRKVSEDFRNHQSHSVKLRRLFLA